MSSQVLPTFTIIDYTNGTCHVNPLTAVENAWMGRGLPASFLLLLLARPKEKKKIKFTSTESVGEKSNLSLIHHSRKTVGQ